MTAATSIFVAHYSSWDRAMILSRSVVGVSAPFTCIVRAALLYDGEEGEDTCSHEVNPFQPTRREELLHAQALHPSNNKHRSVLRLKLYSVYSMPLTCCLLTRLAQSPSRTFYCKANKTETVTYATTPPPPPRPM